MKAEDRYRRYEAMIKSHPDWKKLHEVGKALEDRNGGLTQVRRDSTEWAAWRAWMHQRGMVTAWSDRQPPETMMTVTFPWPPTEDDLLDIPVLIRKHVKTEKTRKFNE